MTGCSGTIQTTVDGEHDADGEHLRGASTPSTPRSARPPRSTRPRRVLQPRTRQAEHFSASRASSIVAKAGAHGGNAVGYIENGDWISFTPYNLTGVTSFTARVASAGVGGTLTAADRLGRPAPVVGTATVAPTGGWETWVNVTGTVTPPTGHGTAVPGVHRRRRASLFDIDSFTFTSAATAADRRRNLALNKPATASSVESAAYPASAAVDGPPTTRWSSAFSDPQWIQVDLGQSYSIDRVRLTWEAAYGSAYQIQTSPNGTTWTTVRSVTGGNGGEDDNTGADRHGPLRAHQRHGPRHGVGLLAVRASRSTAAAGNRRPRRTSR